MRLKSKPVLFLLFFFVSFALVAGSALNIRSFAGDKKLSVVTTIRPLQSLANGVLKNYSEAILLDDINADPHSAQLKPSGARSIQGAAILVSVGSHFENGLEGALTTLSKEKTHIDLSRLTGIRLLPARTTHHHDHGHEHEEKESPSDEESSQRDPHLWLDIDNAKYFVRHLAQELAKKDKAHEALFLQNADEMTKKLDQLAHDIHKSLKGSAPRPYFMTHDAYQYFERYFGQTAGHVLELNNGGHTQLKLSQIRALRTAIKASTMNGKTNVCLFYDQHTSPSLVEVLAKDLPVKKLELFPLGRNEAPFIDGYFSMMRNIAHQFAKCFSNS